MVRRLLVYAIALPLLASCSTRSAAPAHRAHVLRFADIADPDRLNPYISTMDLTYDFSSLIFSYLIVSGQDGRLQGDLATTVPSLRNGGISRDGRTYVYHLRKGVRWHDGAPFSSHDVVFSWKAVINPQNNTLHREGYDQIASIDTPDPATIVVHLKRRYPPFLTTFFAPLQEGGKGILPAHLLARYASINTVPFNGAPVGTGPFRFVRWERGREIVLERNPYYYRGVPKLQRIEFYDIPNDQTILNQLRLHEIDLLDAASQPFYERYKAIDGVSVSLAPWNAHALFMMNQSKPGLNDVTVRRAIAAAIDYDALIAKVTHGVGERAYDLIPPTAIGYTKNPPYRYNPAAANAMLDESGWRQGTDGTRSKGGTRLDYVLTIVAGSELQQMESVQLQQYLRAIGMHLTIKSYTYNTIFTPDGPIYGGRYDFAIYSDTMPWDPDILFYVGCKFFYPHGENVVHYCNPAVDALELAALQTDDPARRAQIYSKAERILWSTIEIIPLWEQRRLVVHSAALQNYAVNPGATPWFNAWQWSFDRLRMTK